MTQKEKILQILAELGGIAKYEEIYQKYEEQFSPKNARKDWQG